MKKLLFLLAMLITLSFTACDDEPTPEVTDSEIVGTWEWEQANYPSIRFVMNSDGHYDKLLKQIGETDYHLDKLNEKYTLNIDTLFLHRQGTSIVRTDTLLITFNDESNLTLDAKLETNPMVPIFEFKKVQ